MNKENFKRIYYPPPYDSSSQHESESSKVSNPKQTSPSKQSIKLPYPMTITPSASTRKTTDSGRGIMLMPDSNEQIMSLTRKMDKYQDDLKEIYESIYKQYCQMHYASDVNILNGIKVYNYMENFKLLIKKWKESSTQETNDFGYMKLDDQLRLILENLDKINQSDTSPMFPIVNCMKDKIRQTRKIKLTEFRNALKELFMNVRNACEANLKVEIDVYLRNENPTAQETRRYLQRLYDVTIKDELYKEIWKQLAARILYKKELKDYKE